MAEQTTKAQQGIESKINSLLKERLKLLKQIEKSLSKQQATAQKLKAAMAEGCEQQGTEEGFNNAADAASNLADAAKGAGTQAGISADIIKAGMDASAGAANNFGSALKLAGGGFSVLAGAATAGMSLVTGALSSAWGIAKAVVGTVMSIGKAFFNVAKAIITLPFDLLGNLMKIGNELRGIGLDIARAWEDVREVFGDLSTTVGADIRSTVMNLGMIGNTGLDAYQVLGTISERIASVSKLFQGLGGAVVLFSEEIKNSNGAVIAFQKGLGFTEEQLQGVATVAMSSGKSLVEVQTEIANQAIQLGQAFGIPKKLIGKDIAEMINDIETFGPMTAKQMGTVSVYAKKLGVDVKKMAGVFKAFNNFEDAAIGAAKLSQAFGMNIDVVKQLKAGSPAEVIEDLRTAFFNAGKDAANLNRHELALLAAQTGLDQETAKRVFSLENQGVAYEDIANKADEAESAQITAANAMKQVAKDIKRIVHEVLKMDGVFAEFRKGMEKGITMDKRFMRLIDIATDLGFSMRGLGQSFGEALMRIKPVQDIFDGLGDFLEGFSGRLKDVGKAFTQWANDLNKDPVLAGEKLVDRLSSILDGFMNDPAVIGALEKIKNGFLSLGTMIMDTLSGIIPKAMDKLTNLMEDGLKWMNNPASITQELNLSPAASGFLQSFLNLFTRIKQSAGPLWKAAKELFSGIFEKALSNIENSPMAKKLAFLFKKLGLMLAEGIFTALSYMDGPIGNMASAAVSKVKGALIKLDSDEEKRLKFQKVAQKAQEDYYKRTKDLRNEDILRAAAAEKTKSDIVAKLGGETLKKTEKGFQVSLDRNDKAHRAFARKYGLNFGKETKKSFDISSVINQNKEHFRDSLDNLGKLVGDEARLEEQIKKAKLAVKTPMDAGGKVEKAVKAIDTMRAQLKSGKDAAGKPLSGTLRAATEDGIKMAMQGPLREQIAQVMNARAQLKQLQEKHKSIKAKIQKLKPEEGKLQYAFTDAKFYGDKPQAQPAKSATEAAKVANKEIQKTKAHAKSFKTQAENFKAVNEGVTKSINNSKKAAKQLVTAVKPILTKDGTIADQKTLTIKNEREIINLALNVSLDAKQLGNGIVAVQLDDKGKKIVTDTPKSP